MSVLPLLVAAALAFSPPPALDDDVPPPASAARSTAASRGPAPALFERATPRFRVRHTAEAAVAATFLEGRIEGLRDQIRDVLGRDWPGVTEVRVGLGREQFEALTLSPAPGWASALAWPEQNIVLVEAKSLAQGDGQQTLRHELVHVALGRLGRGWPRWFQEGMAQLATGERQFNAHQYTVLASAVGAQRIYGFDDLAGGFPERPDDAEIAYAQSLAFVSFLHDRHGAAVFGALVDRVGAGEPFELAFARAAHTSLAMEERDFVRQLPLRYPWWPLLFAGGSILWLLTSGLVLVAWLRRRRDVAAWHRAQAQIERREDAAFALLAWLSKPANDDGVEDAPLPAPPMLDAPWLVTITRKG